MPRPAPPPALVAVAGAFLAGAASGGAFPDARLAAPLAVVSLSAALLVRRFPRVLLLAAAAAAAGATAQSVCWEASLRRLHAWLGSSRTAELDAAATVLGAPGRSLRGERSLRVRLDEDTRPALTVRLVVSEPRGDDATRLDALRHGDRIRVWARLRAPSRGPGRSEDAARRQLWSQGLDAMGSVKSARLARLEERGPKTWRRAIDDLRAAARSSLDRTLGPDGRSRGVLGAMVLGDRGLTDEGIGPAGCWLRKVSARPEVRPGQGRLSPPASSSA